MIGRERGGRPPHRDDASEHCPNATVRALRVAKLGQQDLMPQAEPTKFLAEPSYNGFPAVPRRLSAERVPELRIRLADAWVGIVPGVACRVSSNASRPRAMRVRNGAIQRSLVQMAVRR